MIDKFPKELRSFETRLKFLDYLFSNCFSQQDIITHCIMHKLNRSVLIYNEKLENSMKLIEKDNTITILNKLK